MTKHFRRAAALVFAGILFLGCGGESGEVCEPVPITGTEACETPADCPPCGPICASNGFDMTGGPVCVEDVFGLICECPCVVCYDRS